MYQTFNGWKRNGRVVIQGTKGLFRNEYGDYMYHVSQTVPRGSNVFIPRLPIRQVIYC